MENKKTDNLEMMTFTDAKEFELWLSKNYQKQDGIWVKVAKKDSGIPSVNSDELVDIGLCWGWISGQRRSYDESYYLQKYVPRRPRSIWSQVNVDKVEVLTAAGKMQAPGLAEVAAAKADGRWDVAYASQRNATPPDDLIKALEQNKSAGKLFTKLSKTDQYVIILKLVTERNAERRAAKLKKIVDDLTAGE